jgi:hypothetical protein
MCSIRHKRKEVKRQQGEAQGAGGRGGGNLLNLPKAITEWKEIKRVGAGRIEGESNCMGGGGEKRESAAGQE